MNPKIIIIVILLLLSKNSHSELQLQIKGNFSLGFYYTTTKIGNQYQSLKIDINSNEVELFGGSCQKCKNKYIFDRYKLKKGQQSKIMTCDKLDGLCGKLCGGNIKGKCEREDGKMIVVEDQIVFGSKYIIKQEFLCVNEEKDVLETSANGQFGINPFENRILSKLIQGSSTFSINFRKDGGKLTIGKSKNSQQNIKKTKFNFINSKQIIIPNITNITFSKTSITNKSNLSLVLNTKELTSYFPSDIAQKIQQSLSKVCKKYQKSCQETSSFCFKINQKFSQRHVQTLRNLFGVIQISFGEKIISWRAQKYMGLKKQGDLQFCLGIKPWQNKNKISLGLNWMIDQQISCDINEKSLTFNPLKIFIKSPNQRTFIQDKNFIATLQQFSGCKPYKPFLKLIISLTIIFYIFRISYTCKKVRTNKEKIDHYEDDVEQERFRKDDDEEEKQKERQIYQEKNIRGSSMVNDQLVQNYLV